MLEESQNGQSTRNMIILFTRRIVLENFFQNFNMEMPVQALIYSVGKLEISIKTLLKNTKCVEHIFQNTSPCCISLIKG